MKQAMTRPSLLSSLIPHPSSLLIRGHSDLAVGDRKFSGNAQRHKRRGGYDQRAAVDGQAYRADHIEKSPVGRTSDGQRGVQVLRIVG